MAEPKPRSIPAMDPLLNTLCLIRLEPLVTWLVVLFLTEHFLLRLDDEASLTVLEKVLLKSGLRGNSFDVLVAITSYCVLP